MDFFKSFAVLAILGLGAFAQGQSDFDRFVRLSTALKYGDPCSYENEEIRQNFTKSISSLRMGSYSFTLTMNRFMRDAIDNNRTLCSAAELNVCDRESGTCKCGDPGKVVVSGSNTSGGFVAERDQSGSMKCRWDEGSYCVSDDIFKKLNAGNLVNSKCRQGTKCTSMADRQECSFLSLILYAMRNRGTMGFNQQQLLKDMMQGKVCTCQPDVTANQVETESEEALGARRKRSIIEPDTHHAVALGLSSSPAFLSH